MLLLTSCSVVCQGQQENERKKNVENTFSIKLDPVTCQEELKYNSEFSQLVDSTNAKRIITANSIPNHLIGTFPNGGNPNVIEPQNNEYVLSLQPKYRGKAKSGQGYSFGILLNGVEVDPYSGEFFQGTRGANREWNINALTSSVDLGTDCNNAHVQPSGKYHYHGTPSAYLEELKVDGTKMVKIGYAADGFPIYYKYGYSNHGELIELQSGYRLKYGKRPGDGKTAPNGMYDGTYFQDYEYDESLSLLDECNGRFGKTPESDNEYYYVLTDNFPSSPMCFMGTPASDFSHRLNGEEPMGGRPQNGRDEHRNHQHKGIDQLLTEMDVNKDDRLSKEEVRGPLQNDFDRFDKNKDGYLTRDELSDLPLPPKGRRP